MTRAVRQSRVWSALTKTGDFLFRNKAYILSFVIPALVLFEAYMLFGVYPFGERGVIGLDLNAQYVSYFDYMYDVFAGKENLFYCWSGSLSGEFFGTFAYYLASPFNFIIWLFPRENITEGILAMLCVKSAAVGLSSAFYMRLHRRFSELTTILFSVSFALSGFFVAHTLNPMWLDGLIALPIVLMGVEMICEKRSFLPYVCSLVYIFIANFYIGYMVGIFSAVYFLYRLLLCSKGNYFDKILTYALSSVSAIMICCPVFFPMLKALGNGKLADDPDFSFKENFNITDIFIKLFPATYDTERPEGLPFLYCGTLTLIFAIIWFSMKNIPLKRRIGGGCLLGFLVLSMYIKPVDMLWHGGRVPVWMPFRYAFIVAFLILIFGAEAFDNIRNVRLKQLGTAFFLLLAVLLLCDHYKSTSDRFDTTLVIVIPLIVLACVSIVTAWLMNTNKRAAAVVLCVAVGAELMFNSYDSFRKMHKDIYYSKRADYVDNIPPLRNLMDQLLEESELSGELHRTEKTFHRTVNDSMAVRMYGISHSTSTYNTKVINMLTALGFGSRDHYTRYDGATPFTDDILGVQYVLSKKPSLVPYTDTITIAADNTPAKKLGAEVYLNSDNLGISFLADKDCEAVKLIGELPFDNHEKLASALAGCAVKFYHPIDYADFSSENINVGSTTDDHISYKKQSDSADASVSYKVIMPHKGKAFMFFPTDYERKCNLYINGQYVRQYFKNEDHCVVYLGDYSEGDSFDVKLKLNEDSMYIKKAAFVYLDENEYDSFIQAMQEKNPSTRTERPGKNSVKVTVHSNGDNTLFTSIPYEEGWTAKLDGKPIEIRSAVDETLMCFDIPDGDHILTLSFFPAGMKMGFLFLAIGAVILAGLIVLNNPKFGSEKSRGNENAGGSDENNDDNGENDDGSDENADDSNENDESGGDAKL